MGDTIDDDWAEENLHNLDVIEENENDQLDGDNDDDNEQEEDHTNTLDNSKQLKKEKKKRKFEEFKQKKKDKVKEIKTDDTTTSTAVTINKNDIFFKAFDPESPLYKLFHESDFLDTSHLINPNLLCPFRNSILTIIPGFKKMIKNNKSDNINGSPLVVIISLSAIRCTEIVSTISSHFKTKIAKLFAKHIKLQEQIELLKNRYPIAIGIVKHYY